MAKSLIYTANTDTTSVTAGNTVPLGSIIRRYGSIGMNGNTINLRESGYYQVDIDATFAGAAAGDVTFTLMQDGVAVPGASATETITTASTESRSVNIAPCVRVMCCGFSSLTVTVTGQSAVLSNFAVRVEKL